MRPNVIRLTLNDAESLRAYNLSGRMLTLRSASAPFATVSVSLDDSSGPWITLRRGDRVPVAFDRLYIKWDAQPGQWVELVEGEGWEGDPMPDYIQRVALSTYRSVITATGPVTCYTCPAGKMAVLRRMVLVNQNNNWQSWFTVKNDKGESVTIFSMTGQATQMNFVDQPILLWPGWNCEWQATGGVTSSMLVFVDEY